MEYIHVKVNLAVFTVAILAWVAIGILIAITMFDSALEVPESLQTLFATLTGVIITMITGFTKEDKNEKADTATPAV